MTTACPSRVRPPEFDQDRIQQMPIGSVRPAPENETLYRPVVADDREVRALADSIQELGVQEPLVVSLDGFILSGHRRHVAARLAGLQTVPCRVYPIRRADDRDQFVRLLREFNRQRVKSRDEQLREEIISADPEEAYQALLAHRQAKADVQVETIELRGRKQRAGISKAKQPFLAAVQGIIADRRKFWPLSVRQVHYALLNAPPLIHASKLGSTYANTKASYAALVDLLTRARHEGHVDKSSISDETRPSFTWNVHPDASTFMRAELDGFLKGYWRDLMQSQPNHTEIVGEKNTIAPIIKPVAARYCIPCTLGRGYCSTPPKDALAKRYRQSGKDKLLLLILSDFDPDGEEIAHSLARSLRDDYAIREIVPIKVALTAAHVREFNLPPMLQAKDTSSNYERFVDRHGTNVHELEAIQPEALQRVLTEAIDAVIDTEALNHEIDQEKRDAAFLGAVRRRVYDDLAETLRGDGMDADGRTI